MKIAVSGAHRTGKTSLVEELTDALAGFDAVDEPYYLLEDEGHVFAEAPGPEDFEAQLARSVRSILESDGDCVFDRCPLDLLAYLKVLGDSSGSGMDRWSTGVDDAMRRLDVVVFVPVEEPDRVSEPEPDGGRLRRRVDEALRELIFDDPWGFGVPAIEVAGTPRERAAQVLAHLQDRRAHG